MSKELGIVASCSLGTEASSAVDIEAGSGKPTACDDRLPLPPNMSKAFSAVEARWYLSNSDVAEGFFTQTRASRCPNLKTSQVANWLFN